MEEILEILEKNFRYTDEQIAVMAGKTVEEVREKYYCRIYNTDKLGKYREGSCYSINTGEGYSSKGRWV